MINKLLQIIAPHYCYGCTKIGTPLCQNCKYDIADEATDLCILCAQPSRLGICKSCHSTYDRAWCVGERSDTLERIINAYKFERVRDASGSLATLFDICLPVLPESVVIVPIPTVSSHIRQRGYDHTLLLARRFGALRDITVKPLLKRRGTSVQRGRTKKERLVQAKQAFVCPTALNPDTTYLLIDDVVTTNATVRYAASALRDAGATNVWVAVIARQPLDKVV